MDSWETKSFQSFTSTSPSINSPPSRFGHRSISPPPFGLDEPYGSGSSRASTASTARSTVSQGYRGGGPKEARLKRVAFLSMVKEVDHLYPIKVDKISKKMTAQQIADAMAPYGEVGDVYVPISHSTLEPTGGFAVVRFTSPDAVDTLLQEEANHVSHRIAGKEVHLAPVSPQRSFFTRGTGFHGICNKPVDDGTYIRGSPIPEQDIPLSSCMSRSGAPWGSVRELKLLTPHPPPEHSDGFGLKVLNLPHHLTYVCSHLPFAFPSCSETLTNNCPVTLFFFLQRLRDSAVLSSLR